MKTTNRKRSLSRKAGGGFDHKRPPVGEHWELLDHRTELRDRMNWVALCVVEGYGKVFLKLFAWRWSAKKGEWKLCWANTEVSRLNLQQAAADAKAMAAKHGLRLKL